MNDEEAATSSEPKSELAERVERALDQYRNTYDVHQGPQRMMNIAYRVTKGWDVDKDSNEYKELSKQCDVSDPEAVARRYKELAAVQRVVFRNMLQDEKNYLQLDIQLIGEELKQLPPAEDDVRLTALTQHQERINAIDTQLGKPTIDQIEQQEEDIRLEQFLVAGLALMRNGEYAAAIEYFNNQLFYRDVGIFYRRGSIVPISHTPTPEEVTEIVKLIAETSEYEAQNKGAINTTKYQVYPGIPDDLRVGDIEVPLELIHNTALVHAEEVVHALDDKRGNFDHTVEIRVAQYFQRHKVPMTDAFLDRYERRQNLLSQAE